MHNVLIPALGESITEGVISKWLVADGASVGESTPILELETDKITTEIQAGAAGVLRRKAAEGATIKIGAVAAVVEPGAAPSAMPAAAPAAAPAAKAAAQPGPAAQKLLAESGVDPASLKGTGKDGRVTKGDVLAAASGQQPATSGQQPAASSPQPAAKTSGSTRKRMTPIRQRIAQRLVLAQRTAAILTTFNEVDMSAIMALRSEYKDAFEKKHGGVRLGFMSFFVRACVEALKEFPAVNAEIDGDEIVYKHFVHMGIAVGGPSGLVVPVVRNADQMNFAQIEKTISDMGKRVRDGQLKLDELTGGTFSITNGGVYGSLMSTPILNPPQSAILGMHKIQDRPMAIAGKVEIRPMMYLALSYDHRIIDGKEAVSFLVRVKESIEDPRRLLLGV